jgi:hypothetical protein
VLPGRPWVTEVVTGRGVPMLFAALYVVIVATTFGGAEGTFSTLGGVATLFSNRWLLLAGWLHYLAFDLLIGTWEARDARERGVPHLLLVPCLFVTLMFGPAGWLLYMSRHQQGVDPAFDSSWNTSVSGVTFSVSPPEAGSAH